MCSLKQICIKELFLLILLTFCVNSVFAYDFFVGGIYYNKKGTDEVWVTYGDHPYAGSISIPKENSQHGYIIIEDDGIHFKNLDMEEYRFVSKDEF